MITGIGIISFIIINFSFKLEENHIILKFLSIFIALALLFIIPRVLIDYPTNCSIVINEQNISTTTIAGVTTSNSTLGYDTYCGVEKDSATVLLKGYMVFYLILLMYAFGYLMYYYISKYFKRHR